MSYTFQSATYANPERTAAVAVTAEVGAAGGVGSRQAGHVGGFAGERRGNRAYVAPVAPRVFAKAFVAAPRCPRMGYLANVSRIVATLPEDKQILWEDAATIAEDDRDAVAVPRPQGPRSRRCFDMAEAIRAERA